MPPDVNVADEFDLDSAVPEPGTGSVPEPAAGRRGSKGEQTQAVIVEAALRLFRENGYEATTMRAIAKEAGVATGNAYYYFGSQEELIQVYYARNHAEHAAEPASPLSPFSTASSPPGPPRSRSTPR